MSEKGVGTVSRIAGVLVKAKNMAGTQISEIVKVGEVGVIGEIIRLEGDVAVIQAYEETEGITLGEQVVGTGERLSVELGPGLIGQIFDGVQRPLPSISEATGPFIHRGIMAAALDREKEWRFRPQVKEGTQVVGGSILGTVEETSIIEHKILVPPYIRGEVKEISPEGKYTVTDPIAEIKTGEGVEEAYLMHTWPARKPRPYKDILPPTKPLLTGQRIIDSFFPVAKGGIAVIPGGYGTGKTVLLQTLASWINADIVVYIGCGERGNEMADVLERFQKLKDPHFDQPLMNRTVFVANVSNMPIVAREASIHVGITLAEYYRDMGYDVAVMADSTSRWAEALREISGRLEEMPGEEGYPAYLASRLAEFYARAGNIKSMSSKERRGSITVLSSISPPGGDFSEPVTKNSLRLAKVLWALDSDLAHRRHFPAINWFMSYSEYLPILKSWFAEVEEDWQRLCEETKTLLKEEEELRETATLIGAEFLGDKQRCILEVAKMVKEYFLLQNAFHPVDAYCPIDKTYKMLRTLLKFYNKTKEAVKEGVSLNKVVSLPVRERLGRLKRVATEEFDEANTEVNEEMERQIGKLLEEAREENQS
ncbi:MAG: V-type ATP synthase subunit A [Thermoproteota archaeon]